jgi:hypothetical protein
MAVSFFRRGEVSKEEKGKTTEGRDAQVRSEEEE